MVVASFAYSAPASTSTLLAGYWVYSGSGNVQAIKGSWVIPNLGPSACPSSTSLIIGEYDVGIDIGSNRLRNGAYTEFGCDGVGVTIYSDAILAGGISYSTGQSVFGGDHMSETLTYTPSTGIYLVKLTDSTQKWSATKSFTDSSAPREYAGFIITRISSVYSLVNFGVLKTTGDEANIGGSGFKSLGYWGTASNTLPLDRINMITTSATGYKLAMTKTLSSSGTGFSIAWKAAN